jgi:predicted TIM-barrel fold metal-dependent hydrolase
VTIDAHAHFFNATDVPLAAYLGKSIGHAFPCLLQDGLKLIAPAIQSVAKDLAPNPAKEMKELCERHATSALSTEDSRQALAAEIQQHRADIARRLSSALAGSKFEAAYNRAPAGAGVAAAARPRLSETVILQAVNGAYRRRPAGTEAMPFMAAEGYSLNGVIEFAGYMLSPRHHNVHTFVQEYSVDAGAFGVDGAVAAMVDFNYFLDCPCAASAMEDQVLVHEQLAIASGGYLLPMVAYNPWVDIKERGRSLSVVRDAIENRGCVGVKIYPPNGFFPYNNTERLAKPVSFSHPDPVALDAALCQLYHLCIELDVPVMAHSGRSVGQDSEADDCGGPVGWQEVTSRAEFAGLRICFGHFGGDAPRPRVCGSGPSPVPEQPNDNWMSAFVDLIQGAPDKKVYGDLAIWTALLPPACPGLECASKRLREALNRPGRPSAVDRTLYGTDWYMLTSAGAWANYPQQLADALKEIGVSDADVRNIYGRNVIDYFGIGAAGAAHGQNRDRLERWWETHSLPRPPWARA